MNSLTHCHCSYFTLNNIDARGPLLLADAKIIIATKAYFEILSPKFINTSEVPNRGKSWQIALCF